MNEKGSSGLPLKKTDTSSTVSNPFTSPAGTRFIQNYKYKYKYKSSYKK